MPAPPEPPSGDEPTPRDEAPADARGVVGAVRKDRLRAALFDEPVPERWLGRYRVIGTLGRGGTSTVLEAVDDVLERRVALKLLHRDVSPRDQGRLLREARALAKLSHPHVVQVHEVGEEPRPFIAMELVRGRTLAQWQRERPPWRACVRAYLQAGHGLAAVHAQGLVHRDFKPSNCMIDDEGRVRVMDFGLARSVTTQRPRDAEVERTAAGSSSSSDDPTITDTGEVLGTLAYMSLEQLRGREVDARSDQFSFCVALFEALHERRPFEGRTLAELEHAMAHELVVPTREARVSSVAALRGSDALGVRSPPPALRRLLLRGLRADPARRWPSLQALLDALERLVRPRWRGRLAVATVVGGGSLAAVSVWHEVSLRQACRDVEAQLDGVWDPDRRDQLREVLVGTPKPYAAAAWEGVAPRLDAYATAWLDVAREVCEEARVRQEQPDSVVALRTACLHDRKVALREAVDVLAGGDPAAVERAVGLVAELPGLARCSDVPALLAEIPPPEDPQVQARVQALRDELSEARALRIAGRYADSLAVVERVASEAEGVDHPPLRAEVELHRGWALYGLGRTAPAVAAFEDAYARAVAEGHDAVAAAAAALLGFLVGERQSKHELGIQWSVVARAHARRPAAEPGAEALVLSNVAPVYSQMGELERARASYAEALQLQEQAFGPDDVRLATTLSGLGVVMLSLDHVEEALALHERALALRRHSLGPQHPHVAMSLNNIGVVLHRQGRNDEAEVRLREALAIKEAILGPEHPELVSSLTNLGGLTMLRRDHERALALFQRGLAIAERAEGPESVRVAPLLHNVGVVQQEQGRLSEAEATYRRALAIKQRIHGAEHVEVIQTLDRLARLELERGNLEAAAAYAEQMEVALGQPDHPARVDAMLVHVRLGLARGDAASVAGLARQAYERRTQLGASPSGVAEARLLWSRVLGETDPGAYAQARTIAEQARDELEPHADFHSQDLREEAEAWLAELRRRDPPR